MTRPTAPTVRTCTVTDLDRAAGVLGRAFHDDPVIRWMFGDADRLERRIEAVFATWLRRIHLPKNGVEIHRSEDAVAAWAPPGRWRLSMTQQLRLVPSMAHVFGLGRLSGVLAGLQQMADLHPDDEPHWYLTFLGTEPSVQSRGLGSAVLRHGLDRCDATSTAAYLEASAPENVPFYESFGFQPIETITLGDGPSVTTMWRRPATRST